MDTAYCFHHYRLLPAERQLLAGGHPVKLGGRAFDMLVALIERRDRVVSKRELMGLVWPHLVVEDNNLQVQVMALRKLLGHGAIGTVPGRGYRFTLPLSNAGADGVGTAVAAASPSSIAPAARASVASALAPSGNNLTRQQPALFGRDEDQRKLQNLLERHALVTVAGAGGIGKTRLAHSVACSCASVPGAGVWWVELAGLSDAALVPSAVGQALGLSMDGTADPTAAVLQALRGKAALLVLDNAEHLLAGVAAIVAALRDSVPHVKLLVTSQEVLKLIDEQVFRPGPLSLPQGNDLAAAQASGAVALFVARASHADTRFALGEENRVAVIEICRRLDGIPLAIELAAARVPLLGVHGVRQRLDERFNVLTAGSRAVMRRHQTLRAALEWSHSLLTPPEQVVLRRLGVFAGGFTLEAAQSVAADDGIDGWDVLEHLGALVDKSMVAAEGDPVPRYWLLETTRLYALERLAEAGETDALLHRHAHNAMLLAEDFDAAFARHGQGAQALLALDQERDNLLHAMAWCDRDADADVDAAGMGLRLAAALRYYWPARGAASAGLAATLRALARAVPLPGDVHRCRALESAALLSTWTGQVVQAEVLSQQLLQLAGDIGFAAGLTRGLHLVGSQELLKGRLDVAQQHFEAMVPVARSISNLNIEGHALGGLVDVFERRGERDRADEGIEALLALRRRAGHGFNLVNALYRAARRSFELDDTVRAEALLREAFPLVHGAGSLALYASCAGLVAIAAAKRDDWATAARLHGAASHHRSLLALRHFEAESDAERPYLEAARASLGDKAFDALGVEGAAMSTQQALHLAAEQVGQGDTGTVLP